MTTDSRAIEGGELFIALKGENFDGNAYALQALEKGAKYALVDEGSEASRSGNPSIITVPNTLKALQELARHHRRNVQVDGKPLTVIALTGTNGKTTTKELIREVLSQKYRVTATQGNLNNSIGVPLTLLTINSDTQLAVIEMGASHPGDIKELVDIAEPNFGLITNVGKAHLLGFGSFEGVKSTKGEMWDYIHQNGGTAFLNADNNDLKAMADQRQGLATIAYGLQTQGAQILPSTAKNPYLCIHLSSNQKVQTALVGAYNADNVMAALAVGAQFGVPEDQAIAAIEAYVPSNKRSQLVKTEKNTLIVDAYNANPTSMEAAFCALEAIKARKKAAFLGNMLELGEDSVQEHVKVIRRIAKIKNLDYAVLVGEEFSKAWEVLHNDENAWEIAEIALIMCRNSEEAAVFVKRSPI